MSRWTLGQQRAAYCLKKLENLNDKIRDEFARLTAGLPAMIMQNGFGQTMAFLAAKGSKINKQNKKIEFIKQDKHYQAFIIITDWLKDDAVKIIPAGLVDEKEILMFISTMKQASFLQGQKETLAMLEWLKRYANAGLFKE